MKKLLTYVLILGGVMLATLSGCQKELVTPNDFTPISRLEAEQLLKGWNAERKSTLKSGGEDFTLSEEQWRLATFYQNEEQEETHLSIPLEGRTFIVFAKQENLSRLYFCKLKPDSSYFKAHQGWITPQSFTGYIALYNSACKPVEAYRMENGRYKGTYQVSLKTNHLKAKLDIAYSVNLPEFEVIGHRSSGSCLYSPNDTKMFDPNKLSYPLGNNWGYNNNTLVPIGIGGTGTSTNPNPTPEPKIDDEKLKENPCAQFAWNMLNSSSTSFRSLIESFLGQKSTLNITFDIKNFPTDTKLGQAWPVNGNVTISINGNVASSASSLLTASVFCHEVLHAEIWRILQENHFDMTACKDDYAALWKNWEKYRNTEVFNPNEMTQHGTMAEAYTDLIVKMLTEFDRSQRITNRDPMIYEALAWGGLDKTDEWKELPRMCQEKYQSLLDAQKNEGGCGK